MQIKAKWLILLALLYLLLNTADAARSAKIAPKSRSMPAASKPADDLSIAMTNAKAGPPVFDAETVRKMAQQDEAKRRASEQQEEKSSEVAAQKEGTNEEQQRLEDEAKKQADMLKQAAADAQGPISPDAAAFANRDPMNEQPTPPGQEPKLGTADYFNALSKPKPAAAVPSGASKPGFDKKIVNKNWSGKCEGFPTVKLAAKKVIVLFPFIHILSESLVSQRKYLSICFSLLNSWTWKARFRSVTRLKACWLCSILAKLSHGYYLTCVKIR